MSTEHVLKQFSLTDQVAIVTGGGQGLGREMALALSEVGDYKKITMLGDNTYVTKK